MTTLCIILALSTLAAMAGVLFALATTARLARGLADRLLARSLPEYASLRRELESERKPKPKPEKPKPQRIIEEPFVDVVQAQEITREIMGE